MEQSKEYEEGYYFESAGCEKERGSGKSEPEEVESGQDESEGKAE